MKRMSLVSEGCLDVLIAVAKSKTEKISSCSCFQELVKSSTSVIQSTYFPLANYVLILKVLERLVRLCHLVCDFRKSILIQSDKHVLGNKVNSARNTTTHRRMSRFLETFHFCTQRCVSDSQL